MMDTMTLMDFLLARFAEDEATATNWLRFEVRDGVPGNYAIPERVRAECDAKRRIVEWCTRDLDAADALDPDQITRSFNAGAAFLAHNTLRALALPYADHEDFKEEWRV